MGVILESIGETDSDGETIDIPTGVYLILFRRNSAMRAEFIIGVTIVDLRVPYKLILMQCSNQ